jgi:hypothetical protein
MLPSLRWFRRRVFGISPEEVTAARRGFSAGAAGVQARLEQIGRTFLHGYHAALEEPEAESLAERLNQVDREVCGFAFEGAAMALGLLDRLTPWRRTRWRAFVDGPAAAHVYMVHVGLGWVLARLRCRVEPALAALDPLLRWLVVDGYGFHEGYFHWPRTVDGQAVPGCLSGYARRAFDQGLGRSLWFVRAADPAGIAATVAAFPPARRGDLWAGVGLACAYAGGVGEAALRELDTSAGGHHPRLAQGVAFAAKARARAGNPAAHTELACDVLCGLGAAEAAGLTDAALVDLPPDGPEPAFELWRQRVQAHWTPAREGVRT